MSSAKKMVTLTSSYKKIDRRTENIIEKLKVQSNKRKSSISHTNDYNEKGTEIKLSELIEMDN